MMGSISDLILFIPAIIIAMSFHEAAHAYAADYFGDNTPRMYGRLTLNPLAHMDPLGFLMLLLFHFGWAKPVPVNPYNFKGNRRMADFVVSIAGIATNFILAVLTAIVANKLNSPIEGLAKFLQDLWQINIALASFNILPIPPLDGSKMLGALLPASMSEVIWFLDRYGMFILMLLLLTGIFNVILSPLFQIFANASLFFASLI